MGTNMETCIYCGKFYYSTEGCTCKPIYQKKSNKEIDLISYAIINLLNDCNDAEKYKILKSLLDALTEIIKEEGKIIVEQEGKNDR